MVVSVVTNKKEFIVNENLRLFLYELSKLLEKYDAAIIRSANSTHNLVASVFYDGEFKEVEFEEDIQKESINSERYKYLENKEKVLG